MKHITFRSNITRHWGIAHVRAGFVVMLAGLAAAAVSAGMHSTGKTRAFDANAAALGDTLHVTVPGNITTVNRGGRINVSGAPTATIQQTCVPPPSGMVSWWPGDGNATDIQGSNNGTLQGGATFAAGKVGQAFSFASASNSGVLVPSTASLNPTEAITIDAWVNPSSYPNTGPAVVRKDTNTVGSTQYSLNIGDGFTAGIAHCNIGGSVGATGGSVPLNQWTHLACTYDRKNLRLYVNGIEVASTAATQSIPTSSQDLGIGMVPGFTDRDFDGLIDEVEILNRALSQAEIAAIVNAGSAGKCRTCTPPPSMMVSWWPGDGNANDIQGSNNGTPFAAGEVGQAFSFDGTNQFVNVGDQANLENMAQLTVDAWVKFNALNKSLQTVISKAQAVGAGTNAYAIFLQDEGGGVLHLNGVIE